ALGLGLPGNRAYHALVEIDSLDLNIRDLDSPGLGLLIEHVLNIGIEPVPLGQHRVEVVFAQHPAQRRLRELARRYKIIVNLNNRPLGVHDAKIDDGIHLDRDVIAGNHVLSWHFIDDNPKIDPHHLLHKRHKQEKSRPLRAGVAPQREYDPAFVLTQDAHRQIQDDHNEDCDNGDSCGKHDISSLFGNRASGRFDDEDETVAVDNLDAGSGLQRPGGASAPDLPPDQNPSILSLPRHGIALRAEQRPPAGNDKPLARSEQHPEHQHKKARGPNARSGYDHGGELKPPRPRRKHHNRPDHERDNAADADHSEGAEASAIIKPMPNRRSAAPA